jgi:ribosomal-protein-alanine N-acetyltransferase
MIETARLLIRPMRAEDTDAFLHLFGDPRVMAMFGCEPFDQHQTAQWVQRNLVHQEQCGYGLCAVILKENGLLVGDCGLTCLEVEGASEVELGYDMRSDHWNQGLATEAAMAMRDHAFRALGVPRLVSLIRRGNRASQRVAEKAGMHHVQDLAQEGVEYWVYALSRDERVNLAGRELIPVCASCRTVSTQRRVAARAGTCDTPA